HRAPSPDPRSAAPPARRHRQPARAARAGPPQRLPRSADLAGNSRRRARPGRALEGDSRGEPAAERAGRRATRGDGGIPRAKHASPEATSPPPPRRTHAQLVAGDCQLPTGDCYWLLPTGDCYWLLPTGDCYWLLPTGYCLLTHATLCMV